MLLIDDLLKAPGKAVFFLFQELAKKAQEEWLDDESVKQELQQIYALLDGGKITEGEFETREHRLLERLEQIARVKFQSKWTEQTGISEAEAPVIEAGLDARSFDQLLPLPGEVCLSEIAKTAESADRSSITAGKLSLGADFFNALRPFLDLGDSSESPVPSRDETQQGAPALSDLWMSFEKSQVGRAQPAVSAAIIDASPVSPTIDPATSAIRERSAATEEEPRLETSPAISNQGAPAPQQTNTTQPAIAACSSPGDEAFGFSGAVENAMRALSVTKLKASSVTSVVSSEHGWCVSVELIERRAVPDSNDLLGVYEVHLNNAGVVTRYERTRVRRRNDLTR